MHSLLKLKTPTHFPYHFIHSPWAQARSDSIGNSWKLKFKVNTAISHS